MIEYYSAKSSINDLTKDIETNILTGISHKFELCNEIVKLFDESSIDERDKEVYFKGKKIDFDPDEKYDEVRK